MLLTLLRRGAFSGLVGGAISGLFALLLAEPVMDRAVGLESAREQARQAARAAAGLSVEHHVNVFSRHTQHAGLLAATTATGIAFGVLFGVLYAAVHRTEPGRDGWRRALTLGGAAWFAVYLVPFVRYPANPPGVGDPGTIAARTHDYLLALAIGIVGTAAACRLAADLRGRGARPSHRQLAAAGVLLAALALSFALPADPDALDVPAGLLWQFRLLALATTTVLWAGLTITFGLLSERAKHQRRRRLPAPAHRRLRLQRRCPAF